MTAQTDPMGQHSTFSWSGLDLATGSGTASLTDPDGDTTTDYYNAGTLTAESDWTGTTLASETDDVPDQSAGTQLDVANTDGDGNITTTTYDANGNPTLQTAPDGIGSGTATTTGHFTALHESDCSSDPMAATSCAAAPGPAPVGTGGVITPPASAPPRGLNWTLYDTDGNELYTTTGVYEPGSSSAAYSSTDYELFDGNTLTLGTTHISCGASSPSPSLPCATVDPNGVVTQLAYNGQGDLTSSSTPDGNGAELATTTYGYDGTGTASDGEQTSVTSPDGNLLHANTGNYTTVAAYNNDGLVTSATAGGGAGATVTPRVTQYGYDADGNQASETDPRGFITTTAYNADDEATLVTDPDGNASLTCYDGEGNDTQDVPPIGVAGSSLTAASCPTSYPAAYGTRLAPDATTYTYDADSNQTAMTSPAPAGQTGHETTSYTYDGADNVLTTTAPSATAAGGPAQVTTDTYNSAGELTAETTGYGSPSPSTTTYCYDPNGDNTAVVMPDANGTSSATCEATAPFVVSAISDPAHAAYQTTSSYDSAGDLVSTTSPATTAAPTGATTIYTYDPAGNQLASADANGITTTWTYTPVDEPATTSYSGSAAHSVSYNFDADGNQTAMTDATGSSTYAYDPFDELTSATTGAGNTTGYGYDVDGNVTGITYPLGSPAWATTNTVSYGYDHADQLTSATDFNGHQIAIANNGDGFPTAETLGATGDAISTTYDPTDTPSAITVKHATTTTLQSFSYADAPAGNIMTETDGPGTTSPATYSYDPQGRLTSMTPAGTTTPADYGFDPSGNLTSLPAGTTTTYDKSGELTAATLAGTTTSYTYNADGQRLAAKQGPTTLASATWDGAGQLTAYTTSTAMSAVTYDGNGLRASATTGGTTTQFTWNTVQDTPELLTDSTNAYIYAATGTPAEQVNLATGTITYLTADSLGSVRGTVSSAGTLTGTTTYDAWGNPQTTGGLTSTTPFGYAGGYTDATGLIYLINRYYDPQTGQFLSVDPDISDTLQPYAYTDANPVSQTDPDGMSPCCGQGGIKSSPAGGIYVLRDRHTKHIYVGRSKHLHRRLGYWRRHKPSYSRRVGVRIDPADPDGLKGAEQIFFEHAKSWAETNGYTFDNSLKAPPIGKNNKDYDELIEKGKTAIKKYGGVDRTDKDDEDFPKGASGNIPAGLADSIDEFSGSGGGGDKKCEAAPACN